MLSWFKRKRRPSEVSADEEAAALPPDENEKSQELAVGEESSDTAVTIEVADAPPVAMDESLAAISAEQPVASLETLADLPAEAPQPAVDADMASPQQEAEQETVANDTPIPAQEEIHADAPAEASEDTATRKTSAEEVVTEELSVDEVVTAETSVEEAPTAPPSDAIPFFAAPQPKASRKSGLFSRLAERLSRTRESFTNQLDELLYGEKEIDRNLFEQLEELLITADLGYATSQEILDAARQRVKHQDTDNPTALRDAIRAKMLDYLTRAERDTERTRPSGGPFVIMVIGVNGVGKTTTIGKIAHKFHQAGHSVLLVAADTFRAAAVSQLKIWGERGGIQVMAKDDGSDPSSVVFDAMAHAVAKKYDVVLVDTAGRLHTQQHLMEELKKIKRVMGKKLPGAPHEVLLVLDATTGQNAIAQARLFDEAVQVTGIALTKLDGTAKGGIVINVSKELGAPIRFIGVGEQLADLRDFDAREFIDALFENGSAGKP
ncbi:MAG: signal recognition particle-docking protein FtsY [Desulfobulbaceae bacterium]|jgi:fused signal recognition particle receptor|nr:signal recognition particle-docking protein FtsY [Desulfobulbaceae bacterium]